MAQHLAQFITGKWPILSVGERIFLGTLQAVDVALIVWVTR